MTQLFFLMEYSQGITLPAFKTGMKIIPKARHKSNNLAFGKKAANPAEPFSFQKHFESDIIYTMDCLTLRKKIILAAGLLAFPLIAQGCVSRGAYNENINLLMQKMNKERAENSATERALEIKAQERGRTLSELTTRYIELKAQQDYSQAKLGRLQSDLEGLLSAMSEMKLVIFTNFKGSEANEMMLKLNSMQKTVQEILKKSNEPMTQAAPPETPAYQNEQTIPKSQM